MVKIANISFPKEGKTIRFTLPDETVEYMQLLVDQGTYESLSDALSALTLDTLNHNNQFRKNMLHPVDFPYPNELCPICDGTVLEKTHPKTQKVGFMKHCPKCSYSFKPCPSCHEGNIYRIDKENGDKIHVYEYCTQCAYERIVLLLDNFKYIEFEEIVD